MEDSGGELSAGNNRTESQHKQDRLSALPDSLIHHILSFLPSTREALRTSVLSKAWRLQWTYVHALVFNPVRDVRVVENTLTLHNSFKIKKFHLEYDGQSPHDSQFASKIGFAVRKFVEELILICRSPSRCYLLPEFLSDNASLVTLEMHNCYFMPSWRVNWPSLRSLKMGCSGLNAYQCRGIEAVVSGSPLLELLELTGYSDEPVAIVSKSLKILSFDACELLYSSRISCPNLVELNVSSGYLTNRMIRKILLCSLFIRSLRIVRCSGFHKLVIASQSLKVFRLEVVHSSAIEISCPNLEQLDFSCRPDNVFKSVNLPSSFRVKFKFNDRYDSKRVKEFLEQFQHANKLRIGRWSSKAVSDLDVEVRLSLPLLNCKCLALNVGDNFGLTVPGIARALCCSPMLKSLVLKLEYMFYEDTLDKGLHDYRFKAC